MDEFAIIERYLRPLTCGNAEAFGLLDDVGLLAAPAPGARQIAKLDTIVAGVHFFPDDSPADIAWKALAVNVSDIAGKGGVAGDYLLSLALPQDTSEDWLQQFAAGLAAAQAQFGCRLLGGDTTRTPGPLTLTITLIGQVDGTRWLKRSEARPGDIVFVTATIGDAALGLLARRGDPRLAGLAEAERDFLIGRYLRPQPSIRRGLDILGHARSGMDISDGLVGDLAKLCAASGCAAVIEADKVPLSPAARGCIAAAPELLSLALTGGDDYEQLFTASPSEAEPLGILMSLRGHKVTRIGRIEEGQGVRVLDAAGAAMTFTTTSYNHFAK